MASVTEGMEKVASEGAAPWWFAWLINGAIGGLITVVGTLAAMIKRQDNKTIRELKSRLDLAERDIQDCTEDREDLRATLAGIQVKVEYLEKNLPQATATPKVNKFSKDK